MAENWSAENIVLGCGGGLLQKLNRDTLKFAFKCSFAVIDNESIEGTFQKLKLAKNNKLHSLKCVFVVFGISFEIYFSL